MTELVSMADKNVDELFKYSNEYTKNAEMEFQSTTTLIGERTTHVYKRRWIILLLYSLLCLSVNTCQYNFTPIGFFSSLFFAFNLRIFLLSTPYFFIWEKFRHNFNLNQKTNTKQTLCKSGTTLIPTNSTS